MLILSSSKDKGQISMTENGGRTKGVWSDAALRAKMSLFFEDMDLILAVEYKLPCATSIPDPMER